MEVLWFNTWRGGGGADTLKNSIAVNISGFWDVTWILVYTRWQPHLRFRGMCLNAKQGNLTLKWKTLDRPSVQWVKTLNWRMLNGGSAVYIKGVIFNTWVGWHLVLLIDGKCFGGNYSLSLHPSTLKMEMTRCSKALAPIYETARHHPRTSNLTCKY